MQQLVAERGKKMDRKNISGCGFYNDKFEVMPSNAADLKSNFCKDDFASCARFIVEYSSYRIYRRLWW